jgi:hypothetical protein
MPPKKGGKKGGKGKGAKKKKEPEPPPPPPPPDPRDELVKALAEQYNISLDPPEPAYCVTGYEGEVPRYEDPGECHDWCPGLDRVIMGLLRNPGRSAVQYSFKTCSGAVVEHPYSVPMNKVSNVRVPVQCVKVRGTQIGRGTADMVA